MKRAWAAYRVVFAALLVAALGVDLATLVVYLRESSQLSKIAADLAPGDAKPSLKMRWGVEFAAHQVPAGRPDVYLLMPLFRPLKPTALQVIRNGGDCAYKARAFIVLMRRLGIRASKLALHDPSGQPVHAVAQVETEQGTFIVDLLFGIVYEHEDGRPVALDELRGHREVLAAAVSREVARGNRRAAKYPLDRYTFDDVRTINWNKNALSRGAYRLGAAAFGTAAMDSLPRPYFSEEPAWMVWGSSAALVVIAGTPLAIRSSLARRARRARPAHKTPAGNSSA